MLSRTALRRSLLHVSAVLLLGLSAAWPSVASAAPKTVCTVTINSSDENEAFQRHLPRDQYQFVELVQRGKPDWLESARRRGVSCDVLIISGHFDDGTEFYTDRFDDREFLTMHELQHASCSASGNGLFSQLKEVYLFGCNTLKSDPSMSPPPKSRAAWSVQAVRRPTPNACPPVEASATVRAIATACAMCSRTCRCSTAFRRRRRSAAPPGRCSNAISRRHRRAKSASGRPSPTLLKLFGPAR